MFSRSFFLPLVLFQYPQNYQLQLFSGMEGGDLEPEK